jgi:hypothetical protein
VRAFVAVFGVLQNGKWVLCNFGKEISEGFWHGRSKTCRDVASAAKLAVEKQKKN